METTESGNGEAGGTDKTGWLIGRWICVHSSIINELGRGRDIKMIG